MFSDYHHKEIINQAFSFLLTVHIIDAGFGSGSLVTKFTTHTEKVALPVWRTLYVKWWGCSNLDRRCVQPDSSSSVLDLTS